MTTKTSSICCTAALAALLSTAPVLAAGPGGHGHGDAGPMMDGGHMMSPGEMQGHMSGAQMGPMSFGKPAAAADADRTAEIVMQDIYFEPETVTVAAGETIRFAVRNEGALVHEFNLGTPAYHAHHQDEMMMMQQHGVLMGDHINREMMNTPMGEDGHMMTHDHPNSILLEPGESGEVVWTFTSGGEIEFACNVPGHYASGMVGTVEVE